MSEKLKAVAAKGDAKSLRQIIGIGGSTVLELNDALEAATRNEHWDCVKLILPAMGELIGIAEQQHALGESLPQAADETKDGPAKPWRRGGFL